ncbi:MAG: TolC family protein [Prevotella sp.]|nr:TolC family protein [Prevotella sp.]
MSRLLFRTALLFFTYYFLFSPAGAQTVLSLDSCRAMALRSGRQMGVAELRQDVAADLRRSARTKYLPHVSAIGTYVHTSREISLLSESQKTSLSSLGTTAAGAIGQDMQQLSQMLPMQNVSALLQQMGLSLDGISQLSQQGMQRFATVLNNAGQGLVDALRTDTRNIWAGSIVVTQPVFMGGSITALNRMADIGEQMAATTLNAQRQATLYATDQAYWQVVSLKHKQRLAESFLELVRKLDGDVQKMIEEGVATRSEGLSVSVKVNEAEMAVQKVSDGLTLSRMLLCQRIGLPLDTPILLADEDAENLAVDAPAATLPDVQTALELRPELQLLGSTVQLSRQTTNLLRAAGLPQVALMGGYSVSNPNVLNSFEKKFGGFWNVGLLVRVPLWNWGDVHYKVRASRSATAIANLELEEARDMVELQVSQTGFRVSEAQKRLTMAQASIERAEENLRVANLGFSEGVITPTVVMEAQTAWLQAQSQKIDAEIDVRLSQVDMQKALGTLQ